MTLRSSPVEPEADLGQVVDDVELIAPWVLLLAAALAGVAATGGLQFLSPPFLFFRDTYVEVALFLSNLPPWM